MRLTRKLGILLLAAWLIMHGLMALLDFGFRGDGTVSGLLALSSGILILLDR
jgi:hypothetical protein